MQKKKKSKEDKSTKKLKIDAAISGITNAGTAEDILLHGAAGKEHMVAYEGFDHETGAALKRGLKDISKSKVNPQYKEQNLKQQAGFSAEVKETARENANRILKKDATRKVRTDDIGRVNDPLYDHVEVDANGNIIPGSGSQMKFVGKNPKECLDKLMSGKYKKYRDANVTMEVPSDFYDGVCREIDKNVADLNKQVEAAKRQGKMAVAKQKQAQIDDLKRTRQNLKKSRVSQADAMEARKNPRLSTAKDIHRLSHDAGVNAAKYGAGIGGTISGLKNMIEVVRGNKSPLEGLKDTALTTGKAAGSAYVTAYGSTAAIAAMRNASQSFVRTLSKTNVPTQVVSTAVTSADTIWQWMNGRITGAECLQEMGKNGFTISSSAAYATAGQLLIPIPVVGGLVGGMVGYSLASACYGELMAALKEAKLAREERIRIERECGEAIAAIRQYRQEINEIADRHLAEYRNTFDAAFVDMKMSMGIGDIDGFMAGANTITRKFGGETKFDSFEEFDRLMNNPEPFKF